MKKPFLSSGKNILGMGIEFPLQVSRELDSVWGTSKSEHTGCPGDAVLVILSCVPCKAVQVCRGKVGSGRGPWKDGLWRRMGSGMGGTRDGHATDLDPRYP